MSPDQQRAANTKLRLQTHQQGDTTVIQCAGSLVLEHVAILKTEGKAAIPHAKRIVLDLGGVTRLDSAGIGALVGLYVSAKKAQCEFLLINYSNSIKNLLGMTHLLSVFEACAQSGMRLP